MLALSRQKLLLAFNHLFTFINMPLIFESIGWEKYGFDEKYANKIIAD